MPDFDLVVIGAGAAGLSVAAGAAQLGASVALIEREAMGGECLNTGCVPSKALLAASRTLRNAREAARFGITIADPAADWDNVRAHIRDVIDTIAPVDSEARYNALGVTVLRCDARFIDPGTVRAGSRTITARRFVIAAGSRPAVPEIVRLAQVPYWTNETLFNLSFRPDHLLILGGGSIGLEMADAFSGLGCRVTIIEAQRVAAREDPELADGLRQVLTARGVTFREGATVESVVAGPTLRLTDGERITGSHLLLAAGRLPNLQALNLSAANIQSSSTGIVTDRGLRSLTNKRVYAVGDIADPVGVGPRAFTHVGSYHAGIVLRRILFRLPASINYAALPRVTYTDPELAQTGLTEAEALAAGHSVHILRWPITDNDRAVAERATAGLIKLAVRNNRVIGAGILAPHAGEMISQWSLAISQRTRLSKLAGLIVPYPTYAEAAKRAVGTRFASTLLSPRVKRLVRLLSWLP